MMTEEKKHTVSTMPVLALRGITVFPSMLMHFDVTRDISAKALDRSMAGGQPIFLVTQKDIAVDDPKEKDLYKIGTIGTVRQILRLPGDNMRVMVEGVSRGRMVAMTELTPCLMAEVEEIEPEESGHHSPRTEALIRQTYERFEQYVELSPRLAPDIFLNLVSSGDPGYIADYIAQNIIMRDGDKQAILEELKPVRRLDRLYHQLCREIDILTLELDMQNRVKDSLNRGQKEQFLREQIRVMQQELGEGTDSNHDEFMENIKAVNALKLTDEVAQKLKKEVARLSKQPFGSVEATVIRNYLDVCLELPWGKKTKDRLDVAAARKVLDADHFGLTKVKERILEFLAVKQLSPELKGQIICLVGPPGVGKTSIGMSVARAMHRKLARVSLGGVHDEAEIRGHRKTYVGAMPGRIIEGIRQAGSSNPVLLLDEIDKLGVSQQGDPASALLEVLDSEQNSTFRDHFLEVPYDLSDVFFITTANTTETIPRPLLDRMEVIELSSYTDEEKLEIAKQHLIPKELKRHGLKKSQLKLTDGAIRELISGYTKESGVRLLEREIAGVCRKTAMRLVSGDVKSVKLTGDDLEAFAGVRRFHPERMCLKEQVGVVNGLAWTSVGGELLEVEAIVLPGSGKLELTGNLGDVMKESVHAAYSYIRSRADRLGIEADFYKTRDIHIHFPEGAVPKDGPSAGIAITTAMVSALTDTPVRATLAMTGEVTLRGRVLPIGGLREKTMAAMRNGIKTVLIPLDNEKDLAEIDQTVRAALHFIPVDHVDEVLVHALGVDVTRPGTVCGTLPADSLPAMGGLTIQQ